MYKIIGANQAEYGPATVEQIRQWIAEGRINGQTSCQMVGESEWKPIASFPAFADLFPAPSAIPPLASAPSIPSMPPPLAHEYPVMGSPVSAAQQVNGPAIGLIVSAALGILGAIISLAWNVFGAPYYMLQDGPKLDLPFRPEQFQQLIQISGSFGAIFKIALAIFIIFGATKMKKLENHGLCMGAAIVALIPCLSPCCLLGLPFGIWALVVLNKPEVKSQFR